MEGSTASAQAVQKQCFQNQTSGWVGVVTLDARGEPKGAAVEPHGQVWLTEDEKILTARAPRDPANNPFATQEFTTIGEGGARIVSNVAPLVPISESRFVPPTDRYIPAAPGAVEPAPPPVPAEVTTAPPAQPTPVTTQVARGAAAQPALAGAVTPTDGELTQSWAAPPQAPGQVLAGSLAGSAAAEETAAASTPGVGEETGAAQPPAGTPPAGEYAAAEEVGSPLAPAATGTPPPQAPPGATAGV